MFFSSKLASSAPVSASRVSPLKFHKRRQPKTGLRWLRSEEGERHLGKLGLGRNDRRIFRAYAESYVLTVALCGAAWWFNETSPLGWFNLTPMYTPEERRQFKETYEEFDFPYPGDEEAMKEFIAKGGLVSRLFDAKGNLTTERDPFRIKDKQFEAEAQKLWTRMRSEVFSELQEKGFFDSE